MGSEMEKKTLTLDGQIEAALKPLTSRQRKFAEILAAGDNQTSAALKAGYSVNRARKTASRLVTSGDFKHVQRAIALLRDKHALDHGVPAAWLRQKLVAGIEVTSDPDSENFNPQAMNQQVRTLAEIDGRFQPREIHHRGTMLNVNLAYDITLPARGVVIEADKSGDSEE